MQRQASQPPSLSVAGPVACKLQQEYILRQRKGGASAADLYAFLEKDDDKGKQAVNAALMALKREGAIQQAGRRQPYTAVEHPQADEAA